MKKISIEETKKIQIEILREVVNICNKYKWDYYLFFGTLLGAIRHSGYIPWDDDIDIVMPREFYEQLINYFIENKNNLYPLRLVHYKTKKKYPIPIARIENCDYLLCDEHGNSFDIGLFMDIYPLDGVGNNKKDIIKATSRVKKWKKFANHFKNHGFEKSKSTIITKIRYAFYLLYEKIFDCWVSYLDKRVQKKKIKDCKYIGIPCWQDDVPSYFEKTILEKGYANFEGIKCAIPKKYDLILSQIYGDYMKLPPKEKRIPDHFGSAYFIK